MPRNPRTWITISASALRHNLDQFRRLVGPRVRILPVIKANAYGHGARLVVQALAQETIWGFGVAHGDEALELFPHLSIQKILVLTSWRPEELSSLVRQGAHIVAWNVQSLKLTQQVRTVRPFVHLKLDSGTSRIGFLPSEMPELIPQLKQTKNIAGIFSHLANSEEARSRRTQDQITRFTTLNKQLDTIRGVRHIASTAAAIRYPEAHFGLVRVGIGLYGIWPSLAVRAWARRHKPWLHLRPVLEWKTQLIQVKTVPAGSSIGYGSTVRVKRPTRIGIIPVGYSDGLDRTASNRGWMSIQGRLMPIIGNICMNLTIVNLNRSSARPGAVVELIGPAISVDLMAQSAGTISYEVLSRIHPHILRRLV